MSKEVKRFDCTNGGVQHCYGCYEMTERDDGDYVSSADYDAVVVERDALKSDAERRVPLYEAVERACGELPEGWEIRICLEHNAGSVELYDEDGNEVDDFPTNCERLDYTVNDALEFALQGEQP